MAQYDGPNETFDYVVVGAGSAGAALANRLSADGSISVLLLEAGAKDRKQEIHIPAAFSKLFRSSYDWNYDTVPQPELAGRTIYWPRGKMLGGSSSLNAMMWVSRFRRRLRPLVRRRRADLVVEFAPALLPAGAAGGGSGFVRSVRRRRHASRRNAAHAPPRPASWRRSGRPDCRSRRRTWRSPSGFTQTLVSQHRGARFSAADAYLKPVRRRPESHGAHRCAGAPRGVRGPARDRRGGDGRRRNAAGRRPPRGGPLRRRGEHAATVDAVRDRRPGAAVGSGIDVVAPSPEVGSNLTDHLIAGLVTDAREDTLFDAERPAELARYLLRRRGMLTSNVAEAYGFVRTRPELPLADIEILFAPVAYVGEGLVKPPDTA